jgi:hypothetical protein
MEYTKKDLQTKFKLSPNTVYTTLQVCGLGTSKQKYTQEEIDTYFLPARKMLDEGQTQKQVQEYFNSPFEQEFVQGLVQDQEQDQEEFDTDEFASNQATGTANTLSILAAQNLAQMVEQSVSEVMPFLPALITQAINQQLNSSEIIEAFKTINTENKKKRSGGAAFLLHKMQKAQAVQVPQKSLMQGEGEQEQKQLPQALPENSQDDF